MTDETTPVTDDDRRTAYEWAASLDPDMRCWTDRERAAARVILATVPAPPKTLAGELRELNKGDIPLGALLELADRVEAVEKENRAALNHAYDERDEALVERDDARAEVERLTASLNRQRTTVTPSVHNTDGLTASNDTPPDPADVPDREALEGETT